MYRTVERYPLALRNLHWLENITEDMRRKNNVNALFLVGITVRKVCFKESFKKSSRRLKQLLSPDVTQSSLPPNRVPQGLKLVQHDSLQNNHKIFCQDIIWNCFLDSGMVVCILLPWHLCINCPSFSLDIIPVLRNSALFCLFNFMIWFIAHGIIRGIDNLLLSRKEVWSACLHSILLPSYSNVLCNFGVVCAEVDCEESRLTSLIGGFPKCFEQRGSLVARTK